MHVSNKAIHGVLSDSNLALFSFMCRIFSLMKLDYINYFTHNRSARLAEYECLENDLHEFFCLACEGYKFIDDSVFVSFHRSLKLLIERLENESNSSYPDLIFQYKGLKEQLHIIHTSILNSKA